MKASASPLPCSPSTSQHGLAPGAAAGASGGRPTLAAKLRLALGSQESCSQGGQLPTQAPAQLPSTQPPVVAAGAGAVTGTSAAADLEGLRQHLGQAAVLAGQPPGASPASSGSPGLGGGPEDAEAAMRAVDDIAQYLAD